MHPRPPQEPVVWRITVGHLLVYQVLFLHQIFGDELPGLPIDEIFLPRTHRDHIQHLPEPLLRGPVAFHEDHAQDEYQEAGLGPALGIPQQPIVF